MDTPAVTATPTTQPATPAPAAAAAVPATATVPGGGAGSQPGSVAPGAPGAAQSNGPPDLGKYIEQQRAADAAAAGTAPAPAAQPTTPGAQPTTPAATPATPAPEFAELQSKFQNLEKQYAETQAQQAEMLQWAQYGQQLYRQQQATQQPQPTATAEPKKPSITGVPEFDRRLLAFVQTDPATGEQKLAPGAPPDTLLKVQEYQNAVRDFYANFAQDPLKYLGSEIESRAAAIAEKKYQEIQQQQSAEQLGQQIHQQNAAWMYAQEGGQIKRNWQGTPVLTENGTKFMAIQEYLAKSGMHPSAIPQAAQVMMLGDIYQRSMGQQQAPAPAAPAAPPAQPAPSAPNPADLMKQQFLQQAQASASIMPPAPAPAPVTPSNGMPKLMDYIKAHAPAFGVTLN